MSTARWLSYSIEFRLDMSQYCNEQSLLGMDNPPERCLLFRTWVLYKDLSLIFSPENPSMPAITPVMNTEKGVSVLLQYTTFWRWCQLPIYHVDRAFWHSEVSMSSDSQSFRSD